VSRSAAAAAQRRSASPALGQPTGAAPACERLPPQGECDTATPARGSSRTLTDRRVRHAEVNGQPSTDSDAAPVAGDHFVSTDNDYLGDHKQHSKRVYATDHIICTFLTVDPTSFSFTALCDAQIALPGGMLISDRQTISFGEKTVFGLTAGTGAFAKVKKGTVTSVF
jgi:hypothetical protein